MTLHEIPRWPCVIIAAACLVSLGLYQDRPVIATALQAEEKVLHAVVEKFVAAYGRKDMAGLMALWSVKSPDYSLYERTIQQQFAVEDYTFGSPTISFVKVERDKARLRVIIDVTTINLQSKQQRQERRAGNVDFIIDGGEWRVYRYASAVNDLVERLVETKTEEEYTRLLSEEKELLTLGLAAALIAKGNYYMTQRPSPQVIQAINVFSIALTIGKQNKDELVMARALQGLGNAYLVQGSQKQAFEYYQESLTIWERVPENQDNKRTLNIARIFNLMGSIRYSQGNFTEALRHFHNSLNLSEALPDKLDAINSSNNIGSIYSGQGHYGEALKHLEKSLAMCENNQALIPSIKNNIGNIYNAQGNYLRAFECYQKSLEESRTTSNKALTAIILNNLGNLHNFQGNNPKAREYYEQSLEIKKELNDKPGIALTLGNIGFAYISEGDYPNALKYLKDSIDAWEVSGSRTAMADPLTNIGSAYSAIGDYTQAMDNYQKSLKLKEASGDVAGMAFTINAIGSVHVKQRHYSQALEFAERAAALASQIGNPDALWRARLTAGLALRALKEPVKARRALDDAISTIENYWVNIVGGEQEKQRFFETKVDPYVAAAELLISENQISEAFTYAEQAKGRTLLDTLHSSRTHISKTLSIEEQEQERNLRLQLVSLNTQIYRVKLRMQSDQDLLKKLETQLEKARSEYQNSETKLYAVHPELRTHRGETPLLTLAEADALLPDFNTVLLEFVVAEEKTYLFVLSKEGKGTQSNVGIQVYPIDIKREELNKRIDHFRQTLAEANISYLKPARELYDLLLGQAAAQLRGKTRLVIVPDGRLWELPFQALRTAQNHYLIEDQAIFYTPSLTVLREMIEAGKKKTGSPTGKTLLALGNPTLGVETIRRAKTVLDEKLVPIPETEDQVKTLGNIYSPGQSKVYIRSDASEERFKSEAGNYRILHLATHGIYNDRTPMYSYMLLAQSGKTENEDGLLEAWELMKLDLKAELAVLAGCETARGRMGKGEGVIGLTWSLFIAGCPATIVSQWKVEVKSTTELMVQFHRRLRTRLKNSKLQMGKAEALRQAALKLIRGKNTDYHHPFYWAGFVLVGNGL